MAVEHNTLPSEAQHIIHRWKVADETALNAIVPTLADVDKIALREDNDTYYRLKSHDPIEWVELGSQVDLNNYYTKTETDGLIPVIPDFKTINGETITGTGDIVITGSGTVDLSNYYTKSEVDTIVSSIDYSAYYTKTEVDTLIANLPETDLTGYYTKTEVDTLIANIQSGTVDLSNYYTKTEVDGLIPTIPEFKTINGESITGTGDIVISGGTTDLSNYYTKTETYNKTEVDTAIANVTPSQLTSNASHITQIRMTQQESSAYKYTPPLTTWFTLPFNYASIDDLLQFDDTTHTITAKKTGYYIINMSVVHLQTTTDGASAWTRYALVDGSFDTSLTIPTYGNSHYYSQTFSSDPVGLQETISMYLTMGQSIKIVMYTGHSTAYIGTNNETDTFYSTYINMYMLSGVGVVNEGLNAYELAVQEGFVGTLTDWLNSLKGDTGDTGATGADGTDGVGVPTGGIAGQILAKIDATDYNTTWIDAPTGGGSAEYPDQTGNSGKFLSTDGTNVLWDDIPQPILNGLSELPAYELGVEVLTSERWLNDKPIYRQTIDCGTLPNNTLKTISIPDLASIDRTTLRIVSSKSRAYRSSDNVVINLPHSHTTATAQIQCSINSSGQILLDTDTDYTAFTGIVTVEYTKTADTASSPVALVGSSYNISSAEYILPFTRNGKTVYGIEVDFGTLPNNTIKSVAIPNYNSAYTYEEPKGVSRAPASNTVRTLPFPGGYYADLYLNNGNISVATNSDRTAYTVTKIKLEYTKD